MRPPRSDDASCFCRIRRRFRQKRAGLKLSAQGLTHIRCARHDLDDRHSNPEPRRAHAPAALAQGARCSVNTDSRCTGAPIELDVREEF